MSVAVGRLRLTSAALATGALLAACSGQSAGSTGTASSAGIGAGPGSGMATSAAATPPGRPSASSSSPRPSSPGQVDPNAVESNPPGDIPDNQAFVAYSPPGGGYAVKVPEGWSRSPAGTTVTFTDKLNSVRIESKPAPTAPTADFARRQELPAIAQSTPGYAPGDVRGVTRKAGPGVLITYQAVTAPDPVTGKVIRDDVERYEFWRAGTEMMLTLSSPHGSDNVDPWRVITDSFTWK